MNLKAAIKYKTWDFSSAALTAAKTKLVGGSLSTSNGVKPLTTPADLTFTYKFSEATDKGMCDANNAQKINVKRDGIEYSSGHNVNFE